MNDSPKILQVVPALQEGGVERGTLEMARFTAKQGWHAYVASNGGRWVSELENEGGKHISIPLHKRNPISIIKNGIQLLRVIKENQISLVHTRSRAPAWSCKIACKITGTPLITSFHGTHKIQNKAKWLYNSVMTSGIITIANSQFIKEHIKENYGLPETRLALAPRGFDPQKFHHIDEKQVSKFRNSLNIDEQTPLILMPGRLTRWKGQKEFLQALSYIKDQSFLAIIAGGAGKKKAYEAELKEVSKSLNLKDKVKFIGSRNDMPLVYAASDIVVTASQQPEAFGRTAIEASAMRKPVIATAHGGALETVKDGETGLLTPIQDPETMAKKIRSLLTNAPLRQQMGDNGYNWVHNNFTLDQMCQAEFDVYKKVLNLK